MTIHQDSLLVLVVTNPSKDSRREWNCFSLDFLRSEFSDTSSNSKSFELFVQPIRHFDDVGTT